MRIALLIFLFFFNQVISQGQTHEIKEIKGKAAYPFLLYVPDSLPEEGKLPLLIFLHGRSLSGTDLNLVKKYGVFDGLKRGVKIPAVIIAPQVKRSESWDPDKLLDVLNYVQATYQTDLNRVYVTGMSLGGYGTLHFAGKFPERIAAAAALCGGGNIKDACNLGKTNLWIQHGRLDRDVAYTESTKIHAAIMACNPIKEANLTIYPKLGHSELAWEFQKDTLYNWLFQFRLDDPQPSTNKVQMDSLKVEPIAAQQIEATIEKEPEELIEKPKRVYYIKKGDTLYSISRTFKVSVNSLLKLNNLKEKSILRIGQKIKID
jgi:hypothetical protein